MAAGNPYYATVNLRAGGNQHLFALQHVGGHAAAKALALLAARGRKPIEQADADGGPFREFAGAQRMRMHDVAVRIGNVVALGQDGLSGRWNAPLDGNGSAIRVRIVHGGIDVSGLGLDWRLILRLSPRLILAWRGCPPSRWLGLGRTGGHDGVVRRGRRGSLIGVACFLRSQSGSDHQRQCAHKNQTIHPSLLFPSAGRNPPVSSNPAGGEELRAAPKSPWVNAPAHSQFTQGKANAGGQPLNREPGGKCLGRYEST